MRRCLWGMLLAASMLLLPGCGGSGRPAANLEGPVNPATSTAAPQPAVDVSVKSWRETQQLVAQNPGKVVVIDLWTTW